MTPKDLLEFITDEAKRKKLVCDICSFADDFEEVAAHIRRAVQMVKPSQVK